jgi:hypothetical protein
MFKNKILLIAFIFSSSFFYSQSTKKFIDTGSVKNQFDYLINESNNYQDHKVVKQQWLLKLRANVIDTISKNKNALAIHKNSLMNFQKEIDSLKNELTEIKQLNEKLITEEQQISFLGISLSKPFYKTLTYFLILVFIGLFVLFYIKFKQSNQITKEAKLNLKEVEEEFEEHRTKALEREQKVMRRLQDELNKHKKD